MKRLLIVVLPFLLLACNNHSSDHHTDEVVDSSTGDSQIIEHVVEDSNFEDRLNFMFEEHDLLTKFDTKLKKEEIRGILNHQHEEIGDTLIYSKDFGLSEAIDIEYIFNKRDKLKQVVVISYHENSDSQLKFLDAISGVVLSSDFTSTDNAWENADSKMVIDYKLTGNSANKNIELTMHLR